VGGARRVELMSRRIIIDVALALNESKPPKSSPSTGAIDQHRKDCHAVADAFARSNSHFDRDRFLRDCGVKQ
jgi:hypothetical protein